MAKPHELRCYDYVNRPYVVVRDALRADVGGIFERATKTATGRAHALAANVKVDLGALEVGTDVVIEVLGVGSATRAQSDAHHVHRLALERGARGSAVPVDAGAAAVYPLSREETQIEIGGRYVPPLGGVGSALDSLIGHRIPDASVHRFVTDVASLLRSELAAS